MPINPERAIARHGGFMALELVGYFIPTPRGVSGIPCDAKFVSIAAHPLSAVPADLQPVFVKHGSMIEVPWGYVGNAQSYPPGSVPVAQPLDRPQRHYRRIQPTKIQRDAELLPHMLNLKPEFVLAEAARHPVIVRALHELDEPSKHVLGFRAMSIAGTPEDKRVCHDFTVVARNPKAHAAIVLRYCYGFCHSNNLWLVSPANVHDIFKDALRVRSEAEDDKADDAERKAARAAPKSGMKKGIRFGKE